MAGQATTAAPIILVPGFWLGAWAWDEVASILRAVASPTGSVRWSMSIRRPESAHRTRSRAMNCRSTGTRSRRKRTRRPERGAKWRRSGSVECLCLPGVLRETIELTNDARRDIPSTMICTGRGSSRGRTVYSDPTPTTGICRSTRRVPVTGSHAVAIKVPVWTHPAKNSVGENRTTA